MDVLNLPTGYSPPPAVDQQATGPLVRLQLLWHSAQVIQLLTDELVGAVERPLPVVADEPVDPPAVSTLPVAIPPPPETPVEEIAELEATLHLLQTRSLADDPIVVLWLGGLHLG